MIIGCVRIEAPIPACFQPNIWIIHCLEFEIVDRPGSPNVGSIAVGDLRYEIVGIDVEDMPLKVPSTFIHF